MENTLPRTLRDALDAEIALDEWDMPPHLHLLFTRTTTGEPVMMPLPIPEDVWERFAPYQVLGISAELITKAPMMDLEEGVLDILGLAFFCEGWALKAKNTDEEATRAVQEYAEHHSIADHPDRIEVKMVSAVTPDGMRYFSTYERGDTEAMEMVVQHKDDTGKKQIDGRIFEALEALIEGLIGRIRWTP